ncbi:uncharacterized protein FFFS_15897 [Fusarium fujikuroi]|nr:uncharacterized protein FFFS_15897 [Fusarium fujikuroi]
MSVEDDDPHREHQFLEAARQCGFIIHECLDEDTEVFHPTSEQLDVFNGALTELGVSAADLYTNDKTKYEVQEYFDTST